MTRKKPVVFITGASGGIGLELAKLFAADGYDLILVARSRDKMLDIARDFKSAYDTQSTVIDCDLSVVSECRKVYEEVMRQGLVVDVLVNNAGFGGYGNFWDTQVEHELDMIRLNVESLVYLTKLFLKDMIGRRSGRILNVASTAAFQPGPLMAIYYATKAFVLSFSEAVANEVKGTGVTVTALCPGPTETGFREAAKMEKSMLFSKALNMSAAQVALCGYEGMKKGKVIAIPGWKNGAVVRLLRFFPRNFVTASVRKMQEARRK